MIAARAYRTGADDHHRVPGPDSTVQDTDLVAGGQDVGEHDRVGGPDAVGHKYIEVSANGIGAYSDCTPSTVWPRIQLPPARHCP